MKANEILEIIRSLAKAQGLYCRILQAILSSENPDEVLEELEKQDFSSAVDLVLFFEC